MSDRRDDARDDEVLKAWREHGREVPPRAIDDAIRAAARREVGAKPRARVPLASRPWRWWMPMAAAATIGAIAIGVIQTVPKESLDPSLQEALPRATVPASAPSPSAPPSPSVALAPSAAPSQAQASAASAPDATPSRAADPLPSPRPASPRAGTAPPASPAFAPQAAPGATPAAPATQAAQATAAAPAAPSIAQSARDFVPDAPKPAEGRVAIDPRDAMPARTAEALRRDEAKQESDGSSAQFAKRAVPPPAAPAPAVDTASAARVVGASGAREQADVLRERVAASPPPMPARAADAAKPAASGAMAAAAPRAFDDFVAAIRRALAANDADAAARELRAVRAAHADADARLPEDLKRWAAGVPR